MFLNKIKDKYYLNLLNKFIEKGDMNEIRSLLKKKFIFDKKSNLNDFNNYIIKFLSEQKFEKLFNKNLIWVNSFEESSYKYINKFLSDILSHNKVPFIEPTKYVDELYDLIRSRNIYKIDFEDMCSMSYGYQYFLTEKNDNIKILNSSASFFETASNIYFTHYFYTRCYIYIIKNPYEIFQRNKLQNISDNKINHMQELIAGDINDILHNMKMVHIIFQKIGKIGLQMSQVGLTLMLKVLSGLILREEDLLSDPLQQLSEITSHLIQSGLELNLDYSYLQNYISKNPIKIENIDEYSFSKKELKILDRDIGNVANKFDYKPKI